MSRPSLHRPITHTELVVSSLARANYWEGRSRGVHWSPTEEFAMSVTVAVLDATGVYARHLIPRLAALGFRVRALVRRPEAAGVALAWGAEIHKAEIFDGASVALAGCDVGVNLATSLPGPSGRGDFAANDRLRRDGTPIWIEACRSARVARILQQHNWI